MKSILPAALLGFTPVAIYSQDKVTFVDHVKPVLENKCFSCHNPDKKRGDLDLTSYQAAMAGGGGGALVVSGDPDGSKLITTTTKKAEPFMPPEGSPLTEKEVAVLQAWINGGLLETASSIAKKAAPKVDLTLKSSDLGKPEGPPAMPEHVLLEPVLVAPRSTTITTMAASPWAPLVAIAGNKQVLLYDTDRQELAGVFPYPEGYIRSLKFSVNGSLLIAGGGQGGKLGNAVVWDVKTGKRVTEIGKEFDQVMTADISPNQAMVAIGGPSKRVKVYSTGSGEEQYVIKKHTEWVLALEFSPDGVLLASADRNGNVLVSEASNGAEFYTMVSHKVPCTDLAWRSDSNILASCGEDGKIFVYEMENGKVVKNWDAHPGGALSLAFTADGKIVSVGRDKRVKTWDIQGKLLAQSAPQPEIITAITALHDAKTAVSGDWNGEVKLWSIDKFEAKGSLSQNPPLLSQRLAEAERAVPQLLTKIDTLKKHISVLKSSVAQFQKSLQDSQGKLVVAKKESDALPAQIQAKKNEIANLVKQVAELKAKAKPEESPSVQKALVAEQTLKTAQTSLAELEKTLGSKTAQIKQLQDNHTKQQQAEAGLVKQVQTIEAELAVLSKAAQPDAGKIDGLKKNLEVTRGNLAKQQGNVKASEAQLTSVRKETEGLVQQSQAKKTEIAELTKRHADLKAQARPEESRSVRAAIEAEKNLQNAQSQLGVIEKAVPAKNQAVKLVEAEVAKAQQALAGPQKQLQTAEADLAATTAAHHKTQRLVIELKAAAFNVSLLAEKDKLEKLDQEVAGYKGALEDTTKAREAEQQQLASLQASVPNLKAQLPSTQAALSAAQIERDKALQAYAPQEKLEREKLGQVEALRNEIKAAEAKLASFAPARNQLNQSLQAKLVPISKRKSDADAKAKPFSDEKAKLTAALAKLNQGKAEAQKKLNDLQNQLGVLDKEIASTKSAKDAANSLVAKAEATKSEVTKAELAKINASISDTQKGLQAANQSLADLKKATPPNPDQVKAQEGKVAELQKQLKSLQASLNPAQIPSVVRAVELVKVETQKVAALNQKLQSLDTAKKNLLSSIDSGKKNIASLDAQLQQTQKHIAGVDSKLKPHQVEASKAQQEIAALQASTQQQIHAINQEEATLKQNLSAKSAALAKADGEHKNFVAAHAPNKNALTAKSKIFAEAKAKFDDLNSQIKSAEEKIAALQKSLPEKDKMLAEIRGELAKLEPQLEPLKAKVKQMSEQYLGMLSNK